jgi:hypothetical protein
MAYIGSLPLERGTGLFSQDTFTGDGSTTTFDLTNIAPDGGGNELQVFVANVRQQEGVSNAYTLGFDGSSELKRITFTSAPEAGEPIFVLNPGTRNAQQLNVVNDNTITAAKLQSNAITTAKIAADAITEAKIADDAISDEHLDITTLTDQTELSATAADDDILLVYDTSAGNLKKIQKSNVALAAPTFSSVSPTSLLSGDGTGNYTIVVTGTKFDATATFSLITDGGAEIAMDSVSRDSSTQLTGTVAKNTANLTNANEPFDVKISNGNGLNITSADQINIDAQPVYTTSAGSLGTVDGGSAISTIDIEAADPDSAGNVTFELQSGTIPPGLSTATVNENGVSKFRITGTPTNPTSTTTFNFTLRAVDAASNTSSRAFSITVTRIFTSSSFTASGTFAVPSGVTSISEVLVVAGGAGGAGGGSNSAPGGGGGAGGLIFMPEYPVSPGGTITVTVGCGGSSNPGLAAGTNGQDSVFGSPGDPGFSPTSSVLTAKGGGGGNTYNGAGKPGGSGGGSGPSDASPTPVGGTATQPTQPGNSGAYGFGNPGGTASPYVFPASPGAGGGGGAGAAGANGNPWGTVPMEGGNGGAGRAYTIADGTTSVYYAGGGGGGGGNTTSGVGGSGGGGNGGYNSPGPLATPGQANTGGGGGGGGVDGTNPGVSGGTGGKGIVIVRY